MSICTVRSTTIALVLVVAGTNSLLGAREAAAFKPKKLVGSLVGRRSKTRKVSWPERNKQACARLSRRIPGETQTMPDRTGGVTGGVWIGRLHDNGDTIGLIRVVPVNPTTVFIDDVKVHDNYLRQGVFKLLLLEMLARNPEIQETRAELGGTNESEWCDAVDRGASPVEAMRATPHYRGHRAMGFGRIDEKSSHFDNTNSADSLYLTLLRDW